MARVKSYKLLYVAIGVGVVNVLLRVRGIFQELPPFTFCDEDIYTGGSFRMLEAQSWTPPEFLAGGVNYYLPILVAKLLKPLLPTPYTFEAHVLLCRTLTVIGLGTLMPLMVLWCGNRFVSQRVGIAAAAIATVSPMALGLSRMHYPDHAMAGLASCLLFTCWGIASLRRGVVDYLLAGAIVGVMASVKYTGASFAVLVVIAHVLRAKSSAQPFWRGLLYPGLIVAGLVTVGTFVACNPHVLSAPEKYLAALEYHKQHYIGGHRGLEATNETVFYAKLLYTTSFGILGVVLYALGVIRAARRKDLLWLLILPPLAFVALLGRYSVVINRNLTPAFPMLFLSLGIGVDLLIDWVGSRLPTPRARTAWFAGLSVLFAAEPLFRTGASLRNDFEPDSRRTARDWISKNLPHGKVVGFSLGCWGVPVDPAHFSVRYYSMPVRPASDCLDYYVMDSWYYEHYGIGTSPYAIPVYGEHIFRNTGGVAYREARAEQNRFLQRFQPMRTFGPGYFGPGVTVYQRRTPCGQRTNAAQQR